MPFNALQNSLSLGCLRLCNCRKESKQQRHFHVNCAWEHKLQLSFGQQVELSVHYWLGMHFAAIVIFAKLFLTFISYFILQFSSATAFCILFTLTLTLRIDVSMNRASCVASLYYHLPLQNYIFYCYIYGKFYF